jgi:hypothetical protein
MRFPLVDLILGVLLGIGIGLGTGAFVAWKYLNARHAAELADIKTQQTETNLLAQKQELARIKSDQARGDELTNRLAQTETALQTKQTELNHALAKTTTGRTCLNAGTVRLLNDANTDAGSASGGLSEATGQPAAADGAAASDTDVAEWIGNAKQQYSTCRARLDALIDWEEPPAHD